MTHQANPELLNTVWRAFLTSLQQRGLHAPLLLISDDHKGLVASRQAVFPGVPWQRCQFHLQQNAQAHVPRVDQRPAVARDIRSLFDCPDRLAAEARLVRGHHEPARQGRNEPARQFT